MKSKIVLVFIALCAIVACTPKEVEKTTTVGMFTPFYFLPKTFNGQLKEVSLMVHFAKENEGLVIPGRLMTNDETDSLGIMGPTRILFNEDGDVLSSEYLNDDGSTQYIYKVIYEDGLMVGATYSDSEKIIREDLVKSYEFDYPDKVFIKNLVNGKDFNWDLDFNEMGQYTKYNSFDSASTILSSRIYTWDDMNHIVEYTISNSEGVVTRISKHLYNADGYSYKREYYNGNDSLLWKSENKAVEWDDMGNPTGFAFYMDGELTCYDVYSYIYY